MDRGLCDRQRLRQLHLQQGKGKEYVLGSTDLLKEAYEEFGGKSQFAEHFFDDNWEVMDVTIRCWLLGQVLSDVLDGMQLPF